MIEVSNDVAGLILAAMIFGGAATFFIMDYRYKRRLKKRKEDGDR